MNDRATTRCEEGGLNTARSDDVFISEHSDDILYSVEEEEEQENIRIPTKISMCNNI